MFGNQRISPELLMGLGGGILQGQNLGQGIGYGMQNATNIMALQREEQQIKEGENKTRAFVQKMFPNEDVSQMPPEVLKMYAAQGIKQRFAEPEKPDFKTVGGALYNTQTGEWIAPPADMVQNGVKRGLTPVWGMKDGKRVLGTLGEDGSFLETQLPPGFEPTPGTSTIDLGTSVGIRDNKTGDIIRQVPKDVAGQQEQTVIGKEIGAIKAAIPSARATAKMVSDQIEAIKNDKALPNALGSIDTMFPTFREDTARVESRLNQVEGQTFLQAREMLRGGGQITDFEGRRAEAAMARLNRAQSPEDYKAALDEFNEAVQSGVRKLEAVASGRLDYQPAQQPSNVDSLVEKYRTK